ncbi:hypothetical protein V8E54_001385 [Elaphomyces granulatus]
MSTRLQQVLNSSSLPATRPLCSWFTTFYNVDKRTDWECLLTLAAAKLAHKPNSHNDLTIWLLERHIQSIASQLPQSFVLIRVARGPCLLPPIVVMLAGVTLSCDELSTEARMIRRTVAQFFHHFASGVFDVLLAAEGCTFIPWSGLLATWGLLDQIHHRHDHRRHRRRIRTDAGHRLAASLTVRSEADYTVTPMRCHPKAVVEPSETQLRIRRHGMDRFGLQRERCPCVTTFKLLLDELLRKCKSDAHEQTCPMTSTAPDICVFPAPQTRTKKHRGLRIDEILETQDGEGTAKEPGLFLCI